MPTRGRLAIRRIPPTCKPITAPTVIRSEGDAAVLIKRTQRATVRSNLPLPAGNQAAGGLDRRSFLRRSGLVATGLATIGALPLATVQKAEAAGPNLAGATIRKSICTHCSVGCTVTAEVSN